MICFFGNFLIILSCVFGSLLTVFSNYKFASKVFLLNCALVVLAYLSLLYGFVISDFSVQNVFLNSSNIKPLMFKIAASWASHEGSILLWISLLMLISGILRLDADCWYIKIISYIQTLFCAFIFFTSNPFVKLSFKPVEGIGLNPVLQDVALVVHPPILYFGQVCYGIIFAIGIRSIVTKKFDVELAKSISKIGICALTIGVALGSWWAYRELGWGGFWFFDPVENIALISWLGTIALHHSLLKNMQSWSLNLSILTFLLCILGLFLVRSGMLVSVHSFANSGNRGLYLLIIFGLISIPSLILLNLYSLNDVDDIKQKSFSYKTIFVGNILWMIALIILIIGVLYPVLHFALYDSIFSIDEKYFIKIFIPIFIPIILLASLKIKRSTFIVGILSIFISILTLRWLDCGLISFSFILSAIFLILQTINLSFKTKHYGMVIGHLGFGILMLSIVISYIKSTEIDFYGSVGDQVKINNLVVKLHDLKFSEGKNYYKQIAEFWVQDSSGNITILKPENRLYKIEQSLSEESDIFSYLFYDVYAVLTRIDNKIVSAKIYVKYMMSFIWFACGMIAVSFIIRKN
jgi:cytochrome c-type biogenesis protein CcmF